MHVSVTNGKCQGHGRCHTICPSLFDLDDDGYVTLLAGDVPRELEDAALRAEASCPEKAIAVSLA